MQNIFTLLVASIALVGVSSSLIPALPLVPLNVNIALDVARKFSPLIFWPISAIIFNLAKRGPAYPIGPLAQEEGATLVPSTFNKVGYVNLVTFIYCIKMITNILQINNVTLDSMVHLRTTLCYQHPCCWSH